MNRPLSPPTFSGAAAHYERLRSAALGRKDETGVAPGMTVLLRTGLAAWLATLLPRPATVVNGTAPVGGLDTTPGDPRAELTGILAGMILGQRAETRQ